MDTVFFDSETTGLTGNDRICQISAVRFDLNTCQVLGEFNEFVNPQMPLSRRAMEVTGLTDAFLADKPTFEQVWPRFREFAQGTEGVAHNAPFDVRMFNSELARLGQDETLERVMTRITCSAKLARKLFPGQSVTLDALPQLLGVPLPPRTTHDGLDDCRRLACLFVHLAERAAPRIRAQQEILERLVGSELPENADLNTVVDRLCLLQDALEPLLAAQKAAQERLRELLQYSAFEDERIEVRFQPRQGALDIARLQQDLPELDLQAYRRAAPAPSMKVTIRA